MQQQFNISRRHSERVNAGSTSTGQKATHSDGADPPAGMGPGRVSCLSAFHLVGGTGSLHRVPHKQEEQWPADAQI